MNKILIVDDEISIRHTLEFVLKNLYEVKACESAEQALQTIQEFKPNIIITDYKLPGISGIELTKQIKSAKHLNHIPIILISAFGVEAEAKRDEAEISAYLNKPFEIQDLKNTITRLLSK